MTIEKKYQKLDEISHVLLRPGRYVGSINPHTAETFIIQEDTFIKEEVTWTPAINKIFDEIISNSVDFSKTEEGKHLNTIKVNIDQDTGIISVYDNGGIPVVKHKEHGQYIPEMIFELRSGSNFDDDSELASTSTGQNGEGAALTCIFSNSFTVHTSDGKNEFYQQHTNNSRDKTKPVIKKSKEKFTKIEYNTDYSRFNLAKLSDGDYKKLCKRVYDVAGCNPKLKVYLNEKRIEIKSFKDYINLYTSDAIYAHNDNWQIGISKSEGSFSHISFVNNTETIIGGNHVNYIADQIISKLREYITKKHKIQVKPSEIKNHLNLFINATIIRPRYSSQTKEDLITEIKNFGTTFDVTDHFIKEVINSEIVQSILDWAQAKENALMQAELRKLNKNTDKVDPIRVDNFEDASERIDRSKCICFFTEGLSAATAVISARDTKIHATFPLKGKPVNVNGISPKKLMENAEFKNILTITGLKLGEKVTSPRQLRFGKLCFLTDADCITEDHYVLTDNGDKLISEVNVWDKVLTHNNEYKSVEYVNKKQTDKVIQFKSGDDIIECTPEHKMRVVRFNGGPGFDMEHIDIAAKDVLLTDMLIKKETNSNAFAQACTIDGITYIDKTITTYDLTVKDDHTFFVKHKDSSNYILTHNCDGSHIVGLLVNMFHTFWPELFELGMIYRFKTPLIKVTVGKEIIEFYDESDFKKWEAKNKNKKFTSKYFKGLGTSTSKDFKGYLANSDKNLIKYEIDDQSDVDSIHLAFSKDAGKTNANNRKNWLALLDE